MEQAKNFVRRSVDYLLVFGRTYSYRACYFLFSTRFSCSSFLWAAAAFREVVLEETSCCWA